MIKNVLITGAGGFLGKELLKQLTKDSRYKVFTFDLTKSSSEELVDQHIFDYSDWINGKIPLEKIDCVINCAFARSNKGQNLSDSLEFTKDFFQEAKKQKVKSVINISSQSLYGPPYIPLWSEKTPVTNDSLYAMAKYSTELLAEGIFDSSESNTYYTNLRLSSLVGIGFDQRLTNKFVISAINGDVIEIVGGQQILSFLDVRDAAGGILSLLLTNPEKWDKIYNLGSDLRYSLSEIADIVKRVGENYIQESIEVKIEQKKIKMESGMDSSKFYSFTNWKPKYNLETIIEYLFESYLTK